MYQYRLILSLDKETSTLSYQAALPRKPWIKILQMNTRKAKNLSATKLKLVVYQFGDIIGNHRFLRWVVRCKPMPVNPSDLTAHEV